MFKASTLGERGLGTMAMTVMAPRFQREPIRSLRAFWKWLPLPVQLRIFATTIFYDGLVRMRRVATATRRVQRLSVTRSYVNADSLLTPLTVGELTRSPTFWLARKPEHLIEPGDLVFSGFLSDITGIGRAGRMTFEALSNANVAIHRHDLRLSDGGKALKSQLKPGGVWLSHCNPPESYYFMNVSDGSLFQDRYRIGYWAWELPQLPKDWAELIPLFHEIWTPSQFVATAVRSCAEASSVKIRVVPHPLPDISAVSADRSRFDFPDDVFVFLSMYDTRSTAARKNPMGAVLAFQSAFHRDECDVMLLVKAHSPEDNPDCLAPLRAQIEGWKNIRIWVESLSDQESDSLIASADAFVSLHRSEGFGLSIAQAMALERPVVATGWSGNVDYCEGGVIMVPYSLVPAEDVTGRYSGQSWAEPHLETAAAAMVELARNKVDAAALGRRGREVVETKLFKTISLADLTPWLVNVAPQNGVQAKG